MFQKDLIIINEKQKFNNKYEIISYLINLPNNKISNVNQYENAVNERETVISTSVGFGIAIPHAMSDAVKEPFILYLKSSKKLIWDENGEKINHVFMIGVPKKNGSKQHLVILSELSKSLMREEFRQKLVEAKNVDEAYIILKNLKEEMKL